MTLIETLLWAFQQNYHADKMNASIHCAPVRFSPLTFRLAEMLDSKWPGDEDFTQEMAEVLHHRGGYEEDRGRS